MAALIPPPNSNGAPSPTGAPVPGGQGGQDPLMEGLPKRFGKYTLIRKLATGGMAELFLAIQKSVAGFEKLIVIKRILPQMNQDRAFIDMLLHEARIAATLSHPNIVQIFDVGQHDGNYFIAMEHVHGEDLRSIVRQMKRKGVTEFPVEHALSILLGMCAGLAYAHEKRDLDGSQLNIVHRDISPQNVVITFSGDVKIVDFGIAKSDSKMQSETKSGRLKGKIPYMSPEQARGENVDWRSDIFAAGVMLFELTTGKRLFKGASEFETLKLICERDYPRPSQVRMGYQADLEQIVVRALQKDRRERYQSAREMQADLENFVRRERIPVSTIALSQFMQALFEEKLASQNEALLQGKQLADIIASTAPESTGTHESSHSHASGVMSAPAGGQTGSGVIEAPRQRAGFGVAALALGLVAVAGAGGGYMWWAKQGTSAGSQGALTSATQASTTRGVVAIASEPPGASITINGEKQAEVTPASISKLPIGAPILVQLEANGFEPAQRTLTLTDTEPSSALSVSLTKGTLSLEVALKPVPPGASLVLDGKPYSQLTIDGVTAGDSHKLVVTAPGYIPQTFTFTGAMGEKRRFDTALVRGMVTAGAKPDSPSGAASAAGAGKLNVSARGGWCNVAVDGSGRGPTPVAGIQLSAGTHTVTCTPEGGKSMSASVSVPPDGTARYSFSIPQ